MNVDKTAYDNILELAEALDGLLESAYHCDDDNIQSSAVDAGHFLASDILDKLTALSES